MSKVPFGDWLPTPEWASEAEPRYVSPAVVPAPKRYKVCVEARNGAERVIEYETFDMAEEAFQDCVSSVDNYRDLTDFGMLTYNVLKVSLLEYDGELIKAAIWG